MVAANDVKGSGYNGDEVARRETIFNQVVEGTTAYNVRHEADEEMYSQGVEQSTDMTLEEFDEVIMFNSKCRVAHENWKVAKEENIAAGQEQNDLSKPGHVELMVVPAGTSAEDDLLKVIGETEQMGSMIKIPARGGGRNIGLDLAQALRLCTLQLWLMPTGGA